MESITATLNEQARAHAAAGRPGEAMAVFAQSLAADPAQVSVMKELARAATQAGRRDQAIHVCEECLARTRADATAQLRLCYVLHSLGAATAAVREVVALADRSGDIAACARGLNSLMQGADPAAPATRQAMRILLQRGYGSARHAGHFSAVLRHHPDFPAMAQDAGDAAFTAAGLLCDRAFLTGLATLTICDRTVERVFTRLRAAFLRHIGDDGSLDAAFTPLRPALMALAQQCFTNEFAWLETADDRAGCARLAAMIEEARRTGGDLNLVRDAAAVLACFMPLLDQPLAGALVIASAQCDDADWAAVLRRQVEEPWREREIAAGLNTLGDITDPVSQAVRDQYQENPYPRWITLGRLEPEARPRRPGCEPLPPGARMDILVAGCGTGQHSIQVADLYPRARILAVDLSRASLSYAVRKTRDLGVANITYAQGDILNLGERLRIKFDGIECGGVLHHLRDPGAGLAVLAGLLKPEGMMRLAFYSRIARRGVIAGQRLRAEHDLPGDLAGIRALRRMLLDLPPDHPAFGATLLPDFYAASECRDLLFHVQEICYELPELGRLLGGCGLAFAGFDDLPRHIQFAYQGRYPEDPQMLALDNWDAFERDHPNTFIAMYQFWAYKNR